MPTGSSDGTRRDAILQAAGGVFLRYGYRKTSMDDLARAAGISRQGLYLHFATKDAVFRDSVVLLTEQSLQAARAALARVDRPIEDRLLDAFVGISSHSDGSAMSRDHMAELMATAAELTGPVVDAFEQALVAELARVLKADGITAAWKGDGLSARDLAQHLLASSHGIKQSSHTAADYRDRMRVAVRLVCRGRAGS